MNSLDNMEDYDRLKRDTDEQITALRMGWDESAREVEALKQERDELVAQVEVMQALIPKVSSAGITLGKSWYSHEKITGYSAEQLNSGNCHITARAYMKYISDVQKSLSLAPSSALREIEARAVDAHIRSSVMQHDGLRVRMDYRNGDVLLGHIKVFSVKETEDGLFVDKKFREYTLSRMIEEMAAAKRGAMIMAYSPLPYTYEAALAEIKSSRIENAKLREELNRSIHHDDWYAKCNELAQADSFIKQIADLCESHEKEILKLREELKKQMADNRAMVDRSCELIEERTALRDMLRSTQTEIARITKIMHYPDCWDTAAYQTLEDAISEVFKCSNPDH